MEKIVDIQSKIPSLAKKRRRRANRNLIIILTLILSLLGIVIYFQTPLSQIKDIHVEGAHLENQEEYLSQSGLAQGQSLWFTDYQWAREQLLALPAVKEVKIAHSFNRQVIIQITEKKPIALLENEESYSLVLEDGELFPLQDGMWKESIPILLLFEEKEQLKEIANKLNKLPVGIADLISEISLVADENHNRIILYMDDGNEVHALLSDFEKKIIYYPEMVSQIEPSIKGIFDIEVGSYFTSFEHLFHPEEEGEQNEEADEEE